MNDGIDDTHPKAKAVQREILRRMSVRQRWRIMEQLTDLTRQMAVSGLRKQHPQATEEQIFRLLADRLPGPELAAKVYGPKPKL